jgi:hypothetical protein
MEPGLLPSWSIAAGAGISAGLLSSIYFRLRGFEARLRGEFAKLPLPFALAAEPDLFEFNRRLGQALTTLAEQDDPLFRELAAAHLLGIADEVNELAQGTVTFPATETWRTAYQKLLLTLKVKTYLSVAWVRSADYWNDAPGRQSIQFNYELIMERGFRIERIHILPDELWPWEQPLPVHGICEWLQDQDDHGVIVRLARESEVASEPDLLRDFAVYGDRATAIQELDADARTKRFILDFNPQSIRTAMTRWERLSLFASVWPDPLDRKAAVG